ncbi:MAG: hypothetical protein JWR69_628 [Pedosphaera sp.]|nr:hypothetical protein [Pedosphaera sp.]
MNPQPEPSPPTPAPRRRPRLLWRLLLVGLGLLSLLAIILLVAASTPLQNRVTWLTPAELTRLNQPGLLTRLKYTLMNLTGPLWRYVQRNGPSIKIDSSLFKLSLTAVQQTSLGFPLATNAQGLRAWVLPPAELNDFKQRLRGLPGVRHLNSAGIQTGDGTQASLSNGGSVLMAGTAVQAGLTIDVAPQRVRQSLRLNLGVTSTEPTNSSPNSAPSIRTNLALACQALLPNAHGLVLDGGNGYWFILSPTLVDARGRPIKP